MKENPNLRTSKLCIFLASSLCLIGLWLALAGFQPAARSARNLPQPAAGSGLHYGKLPLSFEPNTGQLDASVKFLARGPGYGVYLTADGAALSLQKRGPTATNPQALTGNSARPACSHSPASLHMTLVNANHHAKVSGVEELAGKANYFIGKDPMKWRTNVPTYHKVKCEGVYPGVDLVYYGNERQLEYDFIVAPGTDPKAIILDLAKQPGNGGKSVIDTNGDLVISTGDDEVRFHKPLVYQSDAESPLADRRSVDGRFVLLAANRVGFEIGKYDTSRPLIIDPVLTYSTLYGGSDFDAIMSVRVLGSTGETYITGETTSLTNFPTNKDFTNNDGSTNDEAFVAKINADGTGYVWSAYLGGTAQDSGHGIAVDGTGNVYITGGTNSDNFRSRTLTRTALTTEPRLYS